MKQKDIISKKYCVYEHWYNGECIYVGKGDCYRPFEFNRNKKWTEIFGDKLEWDKVKFDVVKIVYETDDIIDALKHEEKTIIKHKEAGSPLTNIAIGYKLYGKDNGFYGKKHTSETIDKIREKALVNNTGEKNPMYGKRSAGAWYVDLYKDNILIMEFNSLRECKKWCKENIEGFPVKALNTMFKTEENYKAFHSKYQKFNGYKLKKYKERK